MSTESTKPVFSQSFGLSAISDRLSALISVIDDTINEARMLNDAFIGAQPEESATAAPDSPTAFNGTLGSIESYLVELERMARVLNVEISRFGSIR